jgi:hypothetical protein
MGIACSQESRDQLPRVPIEDQERVVDVLFEVAVVVALFLITVGGIVRCVEIEKDLLRGAIFAPLSHIQLTQGLGDLVAGASANRVLHILDMVGWLARSSPLSGKDPHASFKSGSARKELESFWSS